MGNRSKGSGPKETDFGLPMRGLPYSFPFAVVCWSDEALQNIKFQYSMTKTGLEFVISVIVICLIFDIWDLRFLLLLYRQSH
jgi:hypothetical protein